MNLYYLHNTYIQRERERRTVFATRDTLTVSHNLKLCTRTHNVTQLNAVVPHDKNENDLNSGVVCENSGYLICILITFAIKQRNDKQIECCEIIQGRIKRIRYAKLIFMFYRDICMLFKQIYKLKVISTIEHIYRYI